MAKPRRWDLFCRVIDNWGDIGVCWRLAADLGARGEQVRLWADDLSALRWMAPEGARGVEVRPWSEAAATPVGRTGTEHPGDVVIEAFACDPPPAFVSAMAARHTPPVWINLEYLSAEPWVERCHGLPSPQSSGPGRGLKKWFFHPGFTSATGGLIREPGLKARQDRFDAFAWRASHGLSLNPRERLVVLFCYDNPALPALLQALSQAPTLLALTPGQAQQQVHNLPGLPRHIRTVNLPWLTQANFDHLLWSSDLNLVRGEDSLVRAIWAGRPFVWQLYPQDDGAHAPKMRAFLQLWQALAGWDTADPALHRLWDVWNFGPAEAAGRLQMPPLDAWNSAARRAGAVLRLQADLTTRLIEFVDLQSTV